MKKCSKRITFSIFFMVLILLLSACGAQRTESGNNADKTSGAQGNAGTEDTQWGFSKQFMPFSDGYYSISGYDGAVYAADQYSVYEIYPESKTVFTETDETTYIVNGNEVTQDWTIFHDICACEDGLWMIQQHFNGDIEDLQYRLSKVSYEGEKISDILLDGATVFDSLTNIAVDSDGYVYAGGLSIYAVSPDGEVQNISCEGDIMNLWRGDDGGMYAYFYGGERQLISIIRDGNDISLSDGVPIPGEGTNRLLTGGGISGCTTVFCDASGIYLWDGEGEPDCLVNWIDSRLSGTVVTDIYAVEENRWICMDKNGVFLLSYGPDKKTREKLVMGTFGRTNYDYCVFQFNETSEDYYIEIEDYSEGREYDDALRLLSTRIAAGGGPDIVCFAGGNSYLEMMGRKGCLADLYGFIDADSELGREDLLMTDAMESGEKLYSIAANFAISTYYTASPQLAGKNGWTYDEFAGIADTLDPGRAMICTASAEDLLRDFLAGAISGMVDWETGEVDFDEAGFAALLELVKATAEGSPDEITTDMVRRGELLLSPATLASPFDIAKIEEEIGASVNFIGLPTYSGKCGSSIFFLERFGISSNSAHQEGAWEFIMYVLGSKQATDNLSYMATPVLRWPLDEAIADMEAPSRKYDGAEIVLAEDGIYYVDGTPYGESDPRNINPLISHDQAERFFELLDKATLVRSNDSIIETIISNETAAYFAGGRSAETCAENIGSRIWLYVAEQS